MVKFPYYNPVQRQIMAMKLVERMRRRNAWVAYMIQEVGPGPLAWVADFEIRRHQRRALKHIADTSVAG